MDISGGQTAQASFVAPSLPADQTLRFRVDVGTRGGVYSDDVAVTVLGDPNYVSPDDNDGELSPVARMRKEYDKTPGQLADEFATLVDENRDLEGNRLQETSSGLQYVEVVRGTGNRPAETDTVRVQYAGWLFDNGTSFEFVSEGRPAGRIRPGRRH